VEQKIELLTAEEARHAEKQRTWVREHFVPEAQHKYDDAHEKLRLIQTILDAGWIEPTETWKLQSLGITFGDALAQKLELTWVAVEDDTGRDPALILEGTTIVLFPLTMISKRIERGETVSVLELFEGVCKMVKQKKDEGW